MCEPISLNQKSMKGQHLKERYSFPDKREYKSLTLEINNLLMSINVFLCDSNSS